MSPETGKDNTELRRLRADATALERDVRAMAERSQRQAALIARLRREAALREEDVADLRERLESAEHELKDLRAIRDALTPPELPQRPGLELAAAFVPAAEEYVSGDFYLVAEGPQDATVLVVGDAMGHGLDASRRAAFARTAFVATAPFSDDPACLLSWVNAALIERARTSGQFVTAACVTYLPHQARLRWSYAGHPPALSLDDGRELDVLQYAAPLGVDPEPEYVDGSDSSPAGVGILLYTDGLTEARHDDERFGLDAVSDALGGLGRPSASEAVAALRSLVVEFSDGTLSDDLCLLAARIG